MHLAEAALFEVAKYLDRVEWCYSLPWTSKSAVVSCSVSTVRGSVVTDRVTDVRIVAY